MAESLMTVFGCVLLPNARQTARAEIECCRATSSTAFLLRNPRS